VHVVGNDIVDLSDPAIQASHLSPRFVQRVCSEVERTALAEAHNARTLLWSFFAAKEAGYKAIVKLRGWAPVFSLPHFRVATDLTTVTFENVALSLAVTCNAAWAHAVAWSDVRFPPTTSLERFPAGTNPSSAVRALLRRALGAKLACDPGQVAIVRDPDATSADGFGPPYAVHGGQRLPIDVSLSHDGAFIACAIGALEPH
jgi:phosphopantetheinyl transferase (holo-ACP synthase)